MTKEILAKEELPLNVEQESMREKVELIGREPSRSTKLKGELWVIGNDMLISVSLAAVRFRRLSLMDQEQEPGL